MHFVKKFWDFLHFVDDDEVVICRRKFKFFPEPGWTLAQLLVEVGFQQVVIRCVGEKGSEQGAFPCLSGSPKKHTAFFCIN